MLSADNASSGESGAGKSETTKFVIGHVMELCKAGKAELEHNIAALSPLLEAFGNAKTGACEVVATCLMCFQS